MTVAIPPETKRARRRRQARRADPRVLANFRSLRARIGGLKRALVEVTAQRDKERARVRELEEQLRARPRAAASDENLAAFLADLEHSADCTDVCERCEGVMRDLAALPDYLRAPREIAGELESGRLLMRAAELLVARPSMETRALVSSVIRAVVAGDRRRARRALDA